MQYFDESVMRDYRDEVTHRFLDLWHEECFEYFKNDVEVIMIDRLENPQLRKMDGTINTASPGVVIDENIRLILWLEDINTRPPDPITVTHEIAHWILILRGYKTLIDPDRTFNDNVINLNSLAHHPPLFALQRSLGHNPQDMIDRDTDVDVHFYNIQKERDSQHWISDALYITDHLTTCSKSYRVRLNNVLNKRMPNVNRLVPSIQDILNKSDLYSPDNNVKFLYKITKELKLANWSEYDQLEPLQKHLNS